MIEPGTRGHHQAFSQKTIILYYIILYYIILYYIILYYIIYHDNGEATIHINWMNWKPAPDEILELIACDCRSNCLPETCSYVDLGSKCTMLVVFEIVLTFKVRKTKFLILLLIPVAVVTAIQKMMFDGHFGVLLMW